MHSASCWQWLHWQRRGGIPGVCIVAVAQLVTHWMKCLWFHSIRIRSHLAAVFVLPLFSGVEKDRKMIMRTCGKC